MNIQKQLLKEHSKANSNLISEYIGRDAKRFNELIALFLGNNYRISQRAAMVVSQCFDQHPELMNKHLDRLIKNLLENEPIVGVKRNTIRILQDVRVPEAYQAALFDWCLKSINDKKEAIAVKAFSMKVAANICVEYPELATELRELIKIEMEGSESKGILSRGKHVLAVLNRLNAQP